MTRVLVDLLFYTGRRGGMESYVRRLYGAMDHPSLDLVALASRELARAGAPWFPGDIVDSARSGSRRAAWSWGELATVDREARRIGADLIHAPANVGPWAGSVPVVATVHDLLPFRHPEFVPGPYGPLLRQLVRGAARHAARVITPSDASAADLHRVLGVARDRIDVIPLGADVIASNGHGRDPRLLLALGNRLPHKNFPRLLRSLALIDPPRRPRLVITGGGLADPLATLVDELGLRDHVELRSWIPGDEIEHLYSIAAAVIVPTLFEGFGLPVLEAMARGCPVICSDIPVLHEVAGPAAVYFDPLDPASIARAVVSSLSDPAELDRMSRRGLERSRSFSWRAAARDTAEVFESALR